MTSQQSIKQYYYQIMNDFKQEKSAFQDTGSEEEDIDIVRLNSEECSSYSSSTSIKKISEKSQHDSSEEDQKPNEEQQQQIVKEEEKSEDLAEEVYTEVQQIPSRPGGLTVHFFIYIPNLSIKIQKREIAILQPKAIVPNYYMLQPSGFDVNLYMAEVFIPSKIYNMKIQFRTVLTTIAKDEYLANSQEIYDSQLYSSSQFEQENRRYAFQVVTSVKMGQSQVKAKEQSHIFTSLAVALIDKLHSARFDSKLVIFSGAEGLLVQKHMKEIKVDKLYASLDRVIEATMKANYKHGWLYVLEMLQTIEIISGAPQKQNPFLIRLGQKFAEMKIGFLQPHLQQLSEEDQDPYNSGIRSIIRCFPVIGIQYLLNQEIVPEKRDQDCLIKDL